MVFSGSPIFFVNPEAIKNNELTRLYMQDFPEGQSIKISVEGYGGKPTNIFYLQMSNEGSMDIGFTVESDRPVGSYYIKYYFALNGIEWRDTIYVTILATTTPPPPPNGDIPPTGKINRNRKIFFWDNELIANPPAQSWVSNNNAFNPIPKEFIR
ncbi:MAG: hypothetical protein Q7R95_07800, partial [bacterium]|nr:hypothetical protein [bacterium]